MMVACVAEQYGRLTVKPSKILSIAPIFNSDPVNVHIEVLCWLCGETDGLVLNLEERRDLSWLRRNDFYFVCERHRYPPVPA